CVTLNFYCLLVFAIPLLSLSNFCLFTFPHAPLSPPFPYTTLFRSEPVAPLKVVVAPARSTVPEPLNALPSKVKLPDAICTLPFGSVVHTFELQSHLNLVCRLRFA